MALFGTKKTASDDDKPKTKKVTKSSAADSAKKAPVAMSDLYNEAPAAKAKGAKATAPVAKMADAHRILVAPLITEKATNLSVDNKYVFLVANDANKISVARAIEAIYGVSPVSVNVINVSGKKVSRGRIHGQRSDWRKAVVTLKKGETIKIYEGV